MRTILLTSALLVAAPAFACPMADAAAYQEAAEKVQAAEGTKVVLAVEGMHCGSCSEKVTKALTAIDGVVAAAVDYQTGTTQVAIDTTKVAPEALVTAIAGVGFQAKVSEG